MHFSRAETVQISSRKVAFTAKIQTMQEVFRIILLLLISVLPALFLLWFFEKQDKGEKEPRKLKNRVFFWGVLTTIIAAGIEINADALIPSSMNKWVYFFIIAFVTTAVIEEALKFFVVKHTAYDNKKYNEVMDGITYTIIAGLGFAMLENILYVMQGGFSLGVMRAILAVPAHALFSGIMGYYIGKAKFEKTPWDARRALWTGFGFAVLYHGLYDYFLLTGSYLVFAVVPLMVWMAAQLRHLINKARFEDKSQKNPPSPLDFKRGIKIISATIFVMVGALSFAGTFVLIRDKSQDYSYMDLLYSGILALVLFAAAFLLIRRRKIDK